MEEENKKDYLMLYGLLAVILVLALWFFTFWYTKDMCYDERGTFGDMFGAPNALFSGLALGGIIFTILLQRKELGMQREELEATRKEFTIQNKTLRAQRFENTFFNLLTIHNQIIQGINIQKEQRKPNASRFSKPGDSSDYEWANLNGREVFEDKYAALQISLKSSLDLNKNYQEVYSTVSNEFGNYFRNLYRIIKFVNETEFVPKHEIKNLEKLPKTEQTLHYDIENWMVRYEYTSMVRAQLSDYELLWLFYNCLTDFGKDKFKPLIEEYALLKNLNRSKIHNSELTNEYSKLAFQRSRIISAT